MTARSPERLVRLGWVFILQSPPQITPRRGLPLVRPLYLIRHRVAGRGEREHLFRIVIECRGTHNNLWGMNLASLAHASRATLDVRGLAITTGEALAFCVTTSSTNICAVACQMIAATGIATRPIEPLECNLFDLAVDDLKALAVQAHPTAADGALHPGVCRALVNLFHSGPILTSCQPSVFRH